MLAVKHVEHFLDLKDLSLTQSGLLVGLGVEFGLGWFLLTGASAHLDRIIQ